jgi:hypothetical protein
VPAARIAAIMIAVALVLSAGAGCVRRTIVITTDPAGALVWLNDREVGRTPVEVEFVHYGTYDVRLVREGCEPMMTSGHAQPPLWDNLGLDLVAEALPLDFESEIRWHYDLAPAEPDQDVLQRAVLERAQRSRASLHEAPAGP